MAKPETLTATAHCPHCQRPVRIDVPIEIQHVEGTEWRIACDEDALRQAVRVHALQHQ